jgi:hypothetical protein
VNVFGSFIPPGNLFCGFGDELVPVRSERVFALDLTLSQAQWNSNYACECTAPPANVSGFVPFRLVSGDVSSRNPLLFQYYGTPHPRRLATAADWNPAY